MREELIKRIKANTDFADASIDEILHILIENSDLVEVVACLDMIASTEKGIRVAAFNWTGMMYPCGPQANIDIPAPPYKLEVDGIKRIINEDKEMPILVLDPTEEQEQDKKVKNGDTYVDGKDEKGI